ncbi:PAS/PAC sensor hybrid histidine kinase [Rubellimicrobium mesophilum DSM 19309]|uniref:PAS/PAC sensor hybrid histidine kinase n=1 Tax=Rubellimicrobium mesophilum DSM 19309 TaxID=442562 RepID=A0A017HLT3_9RHOB|nr:PAS/PAC sensor hybrid histidine kinase [Rubellimicrobium mesophilum DSM 19309]
MLAAADGPEALRLLDNGHPVDLLFTDVVLPSGLDGRRLAHEAQARRPGLKVLFTTGYTRNAIVHNGRLDAGVELISKPFTSEALALKVRAILDR